MADATPVFLPPILDFVFKRLFGDPHYIRFLVAFLQAVLPLPPEEYAGIEVVDPHLNRSHPDDKQCVLDVRVKTRSGLVINIEIQIGVVPGMWERMQFYAARLVSEQVRKGEDYAGMPQVICIAILDHRLVKQDDRYHHRFRLCDPEAEMEYPNSLEIHTLELPQLPAASDDTPLWTWMRFLSSETPEEFAALTERGPDMAGVVARLAELSADEEMRMIAEAREKYERDQCARERGRERDAHAKGMAEGKAEGEARIVRRMLRTKMPLADIAELTGLPMTEVRRLAEEEKA